MSTFELSNPALADSTRFWDKTAAQYAADPIADWAGYERTLARVKEFLTPLDQVLELGCGTGTTALRLAPSVARYWATDLSSQMVQIAQNKLVGAPAGVHGMLQFEVAAVQTPLAAKPAAGWDVILAFNLLHLLPDLDASLAHIVSQLRPGGLFISKTACIAQMNPLIPHLALPIMRLLRKAPPVKVLTQEQLLEAMLRSGLKVAGVEHHASKPAKRDWRPFVIARAPG